MNKLAVFVEGQTEQIFVEELLLAVAGEKKIRIEKRRASGGSTQRRVHRLTGVSATREDQQYYALIVDCGADNRVKSDIRDQYEGLISSGYSMIIGIRDVYPDFKREEIFKLREGLRYRLRTKPVEVVFVLGVMEVETWFIAEHTHFARLSSRLTRQFIKGNRGFDPTVDDPEQLQQPSRDLDAIYSLAGYRYNKSKATVQRTVELLSYESIYLKQTGHTIRDLNALIDSIDTFLS